VKLAETIASRIERTISHQGWPEGEMLGTEPELQARYGVSRAVLREAIRLLEHHGVASMRRGGAGGLVVTRPSPAPAVRASEIYLDCAGVSPGDLLVTRTTLELSAVRLATEALTEADVQRLRECVSAESALLTAEEAGASPVIDPSIHNIHILLADISANAALRLFIEITTRLTHESGGLGEFYVPGTLAARPRGVVEQMHHAHAMIAEAVIAGDVALASRRMLKHLEAMASHISIHRLEDSRPNPESQDFSSRTG
jgi:DNA-binding FadR family transcriptional regulator